MQSQEQRGRSRSLLAKFATAATLVAIANLTGATLSQANLTHADFTSVSLNQAAKGYFVAFSKNPIK